MATYYVATTGNDGNPGSIGSPFLTILHGLLACVAGDTLNVRTGTYAEYIANPAVTGSVGNPITVQNYNSEVVWLTPGSGNPYAIYLNGSQTYITFSGINIDASAATNGAVKIEPSGVHNPHHIIITLAELIGPSSGGGTPSIIFLDNQILSCIGFNQITGCTIHSLAGDDLSHAIYIKSGDNLVGSNNIYDVPGGGVHLYNATVVSGTPLTLSNNVVRNNVVHDGRTTAVGQRHWGIIVANGCIDTLVYNNIVYSIPNEGGSSVGIYDFAGDGTEFSDNDSYDNDGEGIALEIYTTNAVVRNNISYLNADGNYRNSGTGTTASNNITNGTDPQFVAAPSDFQVLSGSPAIGAGIGISYITTDIAGNSRPTVGPCTIGAYEFVGSATGAGTVALKGPTTAGSGTSKVSGSGTAAIHGPGTSGSGTVSNSGTGAVALLGPTLQGQGIGIVTGIGAVSLTGPTVSGSGSVGTITGSGAAAISGPTTQGIGTVGPLDPPPTNTTIETAIELTLPASITADLYYAIDNDHGLWYKYTAQADEFYIGIKVLPNDTYDPEVDIFSDLALTPGLPGFADPVSPAQNVVNPGHTYYFQFYGRHSPPLGTDATFTVVACPSLGVPAGTIFIPDDTLGYRGMLLDASDGAILRAVPFVAGESGDVLPNGTMCVEVEDPDNISSAIAIYTSTFNLVTQLSSMTLFGANSPSTRVTQNQVNKFYVAKGATPDILVYPIASSGVLGSPWTLPGSDFAAMAASPGGNILYWTGNNGTPNPILRYDLNNSTVLSDLAPIVTGLRTRDMLVLGNGTILVTYIDLSTSPAPTYIYRYSTAGDVLNVYPLSDYPGDAFDHIARAADDPASFWLWKETDVSPGSGIPNYTTSDFTNIRVSSGDVINTLHVDNFEQGTGPYNTTQDFGPSLSCPFFLLTQSITPPIPADSACIIDFPLE